MSERESTRCECSGAPAAAVEPDADTAEQRTVYRITNMDCPIEEALIRDRLGTLRGVVSLDIDLIRRTLAVRHTLSTLQPVEDALAHLGMRAQRTDSDDGETTTVLYIAAMDCPTDEGLIRARLAGMPSIGDLQFNLLKRTLTLRHAPAALADAVAAIAALGFTAKPGSAAAPPPAEQPARTTWWPLAVSGVAAVAAEATEWAGGNGRLVLALAVVAILTGGLPTYRKGWIALRHLNLNMNALMSIAVTGAIVIGHWPEAAMVMFLFALAEVIEAQSLDRARNAIRGLLDLAPATATVQQPDGQWIEVPAHKVPLAAVVRVRPGERIALDGQVTAGRSTVNQAPITGESLPVDKAEGDTVFAGTINEVGSFEYRVTARADDSTLARIIHAVESAQGSRAPTQRFVDRFARIYTPAVFAVALLVAVVPPLAFDTTWMPWIYKALVLLVVACPCALVISTPVTIVSGLASAARRGILIKGGVYLEGGRALKALALDKTGTLTHGEPAQTDFELLAGDAATVRALAAGLAARSDHPVSQAVARAAQAAGVEPRDVDQFTALPGRGVTGRIDGHEFHLGNYRLSLDLGYGGPELETRLERLERQGKTAVLLIGSQGVLAIFAVADTVRDSSRQAVAELHGLGVHTVMLTGDNSHTAEAIAAQVGIDEARGNLLPGDKLTAIEALQAVHGTVGMVGDGINDAPALARAEIGFAMGAAGTDTAIETADVALMTDDLRKIPEFIRLSRTTGRVLKQNIALALGIKTVFFALTFSGQATMWMAVFADMGASLIVVLNGLRLLGDARPPERATLRSSAQGT
jgi:Cd2+/Zn2+-exporting ATPase